MTVFDMGKNNANNDDSLTSLGVPTAKELRQLFRDAIKEGKDYIKYGSIVFLLCESMDDKDEIYVYCPQACRKYVTPDGKRDITMRLR